MSARSFLFVPATSGRKIDKAYGSAADAIILDLEDAVAVSEKPAARAALATIVPAAPARPTWIRINAIGTDFCFADLQACVRPGVAGLILPKVESAEQVRTVDWVLSNLEKAQGIADRSIGLMGIVETALGLRRLDEIAASSPRLRRLMFGAVDLAADLGIGMDDATIAAARFAIACASRAGGLDAPVDTAYVEIANVEGLRTTTQHAASLGFTGKACIHPSQIDIVNEVFTPSASELDWARRVVETFEAAERDGLAAVKLDGQMLDYPVVEKARRLLARVTPSPR